MDSVARVYVTKEHQHERFSSRHKKSFLKRNGFMCNASSNVFKDANNQIDFKSFTLHHIQPISNGGESTKSNALVLSLDEDKNLHGLIDIFRQFNNVDYIFLTTVFVHFFASNPTLELKERFNYHIYADSLTGLAKAFWDYFYCFDNFYETMAIFNLYYEYMQGQKVFHEAMLIDLEINKEDSALILKQAIKRAEEQGKIYLSSYLQTYERYL